jgi:hypothetical protein
MHSLRAFDLWRKTSLNVVEAGESQGRRSFQGDCLDTGAQTSVVGLAQAKAYCKYRGVQFKTKASNKAFRFGRQRQESLGELLVRLPLADGSFVSVEMGVVDADIPMLVGLDVLDKYALAIDNVANVLDSRITGTKTPLARKLGHISLEFRKEDRVLFTTAELVKLHRAFVHPSAEKLLKLLKRVKPHDLPPDTLMKLQKIAEACATCQETAVPQQRFKVAFPHDGRFAEEIALDLQYIDGISLLHLIDLTTGFGAAQWLQSATVEAVWETFLECWATVYVGYPNIMRTDAGSVFVSPKWKRFADSANIKLVQSGVEAHNSLGIGERYHDPLRRVFHKV